MPLNPSACKKAWKTLSWTLYPNLKRESASLRNARTSRNSGHWITNENAFKKNPENRFIQYALIISNILIRRVKSAGVKNYCPILEDVPNSVFILGKTQKTQLYQWFQRILKT